MFEDAPDTERDHALLPMLVVALAVDVVGLPTPLDAVSARVVKPSQEPETLVAEFWLWPEPLVVLFDVTVCPAVNGSTTTDAFAEPATVTAAAIPTIEEIKVLLRI